MSNRRQQLWHLTAMTKIRPSTDLRRLPLRLRYNLCDLQYGQFMALTENQELRCKVFYAVVLVDDGLCVS